jgi:hypothetical protein
MLFFNNRNSSVCSATTSLRARASCDFAAARLTHNIASQALLAGFHEVLGPFVIQTLSNAFSAAQFGNAVFTSQAVQDNAYLLLRTVLLARLALDVSNRLF